MRSLFAGITTRGRAFIAAGIVAGFFGLGLGQRELVSLRREFSRLHEGLFEAYMATRKVQHR